MHKTIAIIGGGAAGLMAAASSMEFAPLTQAIGTSCVQEALQEADFAGRKSLKEAPYRENVKASLRNPPEILLFEKNSYLGAKVIISGGGRCNVTTGIFDVRKLLENYPRGAKFLMSAMYRFPPEKVMAWFEERGVPLKMEDDLRVFPVSDNGKDIVEALEKAMNDESNSGRSVKVLLNAQVKSIQKEKEPTSPAPGIGSSCGGAKFLIELKNGKTYSADFVILTTGGNAYRQTGSTGDGYAFAKALGHSITPLAPSLHAFILDEKWVVNLAGVSFNKVKITLPSSYGKTIFSRVGPCVFTHKGISGPAVFALSSMAAYEKFDAQHPMTLRLNFFPDENAEKLKTRFEVLMKKNPKKMVVNFLDFLLPKSLSEVIGEIAGLNTGLAVANLKKAQLQTILRLVQNFPLSVVGRGSGDEFVTAGGVKLDEVNTNTMESKICPGLYFAGEILDVDGFTGGFNLQASWATGRLAGESVAQKISEI